MGNRAVITQSTADSAPAIYLHWNGGRASIDGFLQAARVAGLYGDDPLIMDKLAINNLLPNTEIVEKSP